MVLATGAALDLFFLGEQRLQRGVGLLDQRRGLLGRRLLPLGDRAPGRPGLDRLTTVYSSGGLLSPAVKAELAGRLVQLDPDDAIILCWAMPSWVESGPENPEGYAPLEFFERTVIPDRAMLRLSLSGDLHHYARYQGQEFRSLPGLKR